VNKRWHECTQNKDYNLNINLSGRKLAVADIALNYGGGKHFQDLLELYVRDLDGLPIKQLLNNKTIKYSIMQEFI